MKRRGFGAGKWNGFGGKVNEDETIEEAARREIKEEAGINVGNLEKLGFISFEFRGDPKLLHVHIFKAGDFEGEPRETEEMTPRWYNINEIPFDKMWPDDRYWFPFFLEGKKFKGKFLFEGTDENPKVLEQDLRAVESL